MTERDPLLELSTLVADGETLDWDLAERKASGEHRELVRALRAVSEIGRVNRTLHGEAVDTAEWPTAAKWGLLEILEKLGEGSFGEIFRAHDAQLDREVALKLHRPDAVSEQRIAGAVREGRLLARVRHPNVVIVYGADQHQGRFGMWMELIHGRTLSEALQEQGSFGAREAALIGIDLTKALAAVHAQGIAHRDVKAQNVMREEGGRTVLMDFGIGRDLEVAAGDQPSLSGTPLYLAPEVFEGDEGSVRSDLYSLGVLLYHLVTGSFPVEGKSLEQLRQAHRQGEVQLLRDARPDLPDGYVRVVERALARDSARRYASAGKMEQALSEILGTESGTAVPAPRVPHTRHRWWLAAVLLVLSVLALRLLPPPSSDAPQHPPLTVESPEAERRYHQAVEVYAEGRTEEAMALLHAALELDPDFAMAHCRLAIYQNGSGLLAEALESSQQAYDLRAEVSERENNFISANYHIYRKQYGEARTYLLQVSVLDPENATAQRQLALLEENLLSPRRGLEPARRACELAPEDVINRGVLVVLLAAADRPEDALRELAAAREQLGDATYFHWGEGLARLVAGDPEGAQQAYEKLLQGADTYASHGRLELASALTYQGKLHQAITVLEEGLGLDSREGFQRGTVTKNIFLARIYSWLGKEDEALRALGQIEALANLPANLPSLRDATVFMAELGQIERGEALLERIERLDDEYASHLSRGSVAQIRGELKKASDPDAARAHFEDAMIWDDASTLRSVARFWIEQGECDQALPFLGRILSHKGQILRAGLSGQWSLAHLDRARCESVLGRPEDAVTSFDAFLRLWGEEAHLGLVREARHEREKLVATLGWQVKSYPVLAGSGNS